MELVEKTPFGMWNVKKREQEVMAMQTTYPGTTIETTSIYKGSTRVLFDGIFATGGITLSQVSVMTGLEPYLIQNWVKRGFVSSPQKRVYSKDQFARIIIINMLRESLQIERICGLIKVIAGPTDDSSDDLISDSELYHLYVDMISDSELNFGKEQTVYAAANNIAKDFAESFPGARKKLVDILRAMVYAHAASKLRNFSENILAEL